MRSLALIFDVRRRSANTELLAAKLAVGDYFLRKAKTQTATRAIKSSPPIGLFCSVGIKFGATKSRFEKMMVM